METSLSGKVALVTGASSGLGARFAKLLAADGATVAMAARRTDRLKELRAEIEADGGQAHAYSMDVTDSLSVKNAVAQVEADFGRIDVLVNNSGVSTSGRLLDVTEDDYDYMLNTNAKGAFFVAQHTAKVMIAKKTQDRVLGFIGEPHVNVLNLNLALDTVSAKP